ncbi:hypothetical protein C0J52_13402 [Blattella germanica]|nr:hypothetical protein C0J52_13402 [Blattella germanica]
MIYISRPVIPKHMKEQVMSVRHMGYWFMGSKLKVCVRNVNQGRTISKEFILSAENRSNCIAKLKNIKPIRLSEAEPVKKAAILVPLCVVNDEISLLYTLRSSDLKSYRGQVSFPGGVQDKTDKTLEETAVRETFEELGIKKSQIEIWGHGSFVGTRQKDIAVLPFVGYLGEVSLEDLSLNEKEVESVFTVPLRHFTDPTNCRYTQFRNGYVLPTFIGGEHRIWGMTAIVTHFVLNALLPPGAYTHKLHYVRPLKSVVEWLHGPMFKIYCSYALSSWSDRMWWFAGGIFMKDLSGSKHDNLMLTGVFTFALSGSVVAFGAAVGRWVDSTPRLKAVRIALVVQNSMLVVCAATVAILFGCWDDILAVWDGNLLIVLQTVIVLTASISRVASIASMIIMQKDWIVVLANGDLNHLAKVNSAFRAIDLLTQVVAPVVVGIVQDQISKLISAVSIAVWNICSMFVEYYLLWLIYKENPNLSVKSIKTHSSRCTERYADHFECPEGGSKKNWLQYRYHAYCYDWHTYIKHPVRLAGLALALLYMTVLGFDAVTTGIIQLIKNITLYLLNYLTHSLPATFGLIYMPSTGVFKCLDQVTHCLTKIKITYKILIRQI